MHAIGIERLCVFDMPPVAFVQLTADLGGAGIGIGLVPMGRSNPHGYPDWSLRGPVLRRETKRAMDGTGVRLTLVEGFAILPGRDVRDCVGDLDIVAELGGERVNMVSMDRDPGRTLDQFALASELAGERGLEVCPEIGAGRIPTLDVALSVLRHVARPNFKLLFDTMHFFRLGGTVAALRDAVAEEGSGLIGYVQLCDVPRQSPFESYMEEALNERLVPGEGDLPLRAFLALVPPSVVVSLEVPRLSLAERHVSPSERIAPCLLATELILQSLDAEDGASKP